MIRNPGNTVITVEFTRKGDAFPATQWDLESAARTILNNYRNTYDLVNVEVTGTREEPGTVTLTAEEYDALTSKDSDTSTDAPVSSI